MHPSSFTASGPPRFLKPFRAPWLSCQTWDGNALPDETVYGALLADLREANTKRTVAEAASRLNHEISGFRRLIMRTARHADKLDATSPQTSLIEFEAKWGDLAFWRAIAAASKPYSLRYVLKAVDLDETLEGEVAAAPADQRVFIHLLLQTLWISVVVTLLSFACAYPLAYFMAASSGRWAGLLLIVVLLPFWTSVLVRTAAWIVILQNKGILNTVLLSLGVIAEPLELIFNRFGVYVAMVYVLLPFMVLPLYSVMKSIKPDQLRAAGSLGATPFAAFFPSTCRKRYPELVQAACWCLFKP